MVVCTPCCATENGKLVYSDNNLILVYYQCTRLLEDGTCDSDHVHLDITMKDTRHMQPHQLLWFKVLARQLCLDIDDMQTVLHDGTSLCVCDVIAQQYVLFTHV